MKVRAGILLRVSLAAFVAIAVYAAVSGASRDINIKTTTVTTSVSTTTSVPSTTTSTTTLPATTTTTVRSTIMNAPPAAGQAPANSSEGRKPDRNCPPGQSPDPATNQCKTDGATSGVG